MTLSELDQYRWDRMWQRCEQMGDNLVSCLENQRRQIRLHGLSWKIRDVLAKNSFPISTHDLIINGVRGRVRVSMDNLPEIFQSNTDGPAKMISLTEKGKEIRSDLVDLYERFGVC